jgi:hypothetical protein
VHQASQFGRGVTYGHHGGIGGLMACWIGNSIN